MRRIDTATKAVDLFGAGKHGFKNGDPALAILATKLNAEFFNSVQEELANLIELSGQTLNSADNTQLYQAVQLLGATLLSKSVAGGSNVTLTTAESRNTIILLTGVLTANINVIVPAVGRQWIIVNNTTGAYTVTVKTAAGSGIAIAQALALQLFCDGVNVVQPGAVATGLQPGEVSFFATNTAPTGYLKANGAAISRTSYAALFAALVTAAGFTAKSFTVTIASPGVFTYAGHGFSNGARVRLATTGALPTGLTAGVDYFVEVIDANTFYLATTLLGARIVTSGSQSGTHSYLQSWFGLGDGSTTFNLPDLRGEFLRGWDDGRSVDAGRVFGSAQMDAMQNIVGTFSQGGSVGGTGPFSTTGSYGGVGQNAQVNYTSTFDASRVVRTSTEERPRNVAVLACIKY